MRYVKACTLTMLMAAFLCPSAVSQEGTEIAAIDQPGEKETANTEVVEQPADDAVAQASALGESMPENHEQEQETEVAENVSELGNERDSTHRSEMEINWRQFPDDPIGVLGLVLLAFAVMFTYRTLKSANTTNKVAQDTLHETLRPWIEIGAEYTGPIEWSDGSTKFDFEITVKNHGSSPALNVVVSVKIQLNRAGVGVEDFLAFAERQLAHYEKHTKNKIPTENKNHVHAVGFDLFPGNDNTNIYSLMLGKKRLDELNLVRSEKSDASDRLNASLYITAEYKSKYDDQPKQTQMMWSIRRRQPIGEYGVALRVGEYMNPGEVHLTHLPLGAGNLR